MWILQNYKWTPEQVLSLTLRQVRLCLLDIEKARKEQAAAQIEAVQESLEERDKDWLKFFAAKALRT